MEQVWNQRKLELIDEMIASNFVQHEAQAPFPVTGPEGVRQFIKHYLAAFPDLHFTVDDVVAEGQTVVTRWTSTATHTGDLPGIPATGRRISVTGMFSSRVEDGKFVESWSNWDALGLLQQLGVAPAQPLEQAA
jgi:steroid delta-isomerase-like uncharacterized protein